MLIERHTTAERLNAILNHPSVRPDVAPPSAGVLDLSDGVANQNNVLLLGPNGGCLFVKLMYGIYEVHTQALPDGRGPEMRQVAEECVDWMFSRTDAFEVTTRVPEKHRLAEALALATGFRHEMTIPDATEWRGQRQAIKVLGLRIQDWAVGTKAFDEIGRDFHDFMHKEADRLGITDQPHAENALHNKYVGMSIEMVRHGFPAKAVQIYNRAALLMRHRTVQLLSANPIAIRFDIGILKFEDGRFVIEREH